MQDLAEGKELIVGYNALVPLNFADGLLVYGDAPDLHPGGEFLLTEPALLARGAQPVGYDVFVFAPSCGLHAAPRREKMP